MRFFEILTPLILSTYLVWPHPRPSLLRLLPAAALISVLAHLLLEGYRWQMVPLYILTALLLAGSMSKTQSPIDWKPVASYLTFGLVAVSTAIPLLLPIPRIPSPAGPYSVGTQIVELTDGARREIYSGRDEERRFMIQVWYPSETGSSFERAHWMDNAEIYAPAISRQIGMPSFFLDHLALVRVPAYRNAEIAAANQSFPVILFSHGWNGFNAQNSGQALELASRGFVVVGVQHTYGAAITVFPDGTVANNNPSALPEGASQDEYESAARILANQWAGDLGFTLDYLKNQNEDQASPFHNTLDLARVGVYGHSTGGGAAIQFCGTDPRCIALLGMDPFMRPVSQNVIDAGLIQPAFFMFSQRWADDVASRNNELFNRFYIHVSKPLGVIAVAGTAHYDFSDLPLLSPLAPQLGLKGPIPGDQVTTIVNTYLISFFETTLNDKPSPFFQGASVFPEVTFVKSSKSAPSDTTSP